MPIVGPKFGQIMIRTARAVEDGRKTTVAKAAEVAKTEHLKIMRPDSGGDLRLSGVGKAGASVGVSIRMRGSGEALVRWSGPLHLLEANMPGHVIRSRNVKGRRRRGFVGPVMEGQFVGGRKAVIHIPGVGFRRSARHPGTKGKQTWSRGQEKATPKVLKALGENMTNIIGKAARP